RRILRVAGAVAGSSVAKMVAEVARVLTSGSLAIPLAKRTGELGLSSTTDKQKEAAWRVEFEALGEQLVFGSVRRGEVHNDEAKRQAALRWLSERDRLRDRREVRWALGVAIAGVLIGIICLLVAVY